MNVRREGGGRDVGGSKVVKRVNEKLRKKTRERNKKEENK